MTNDYVFALDIGTRTVVGLLCRVTETDNLVVEHYCVERHPQRAMLDGQIHEVGQVSAVLARVKENLEEKVGVVLERAAIAAAGRALSTLRTSARIDLSSTREITAADLHSLEIQVLAKAREEMAKEQASLYCVGYSPVAYTLNDMKIANPLGQRGSSIGVDIIATFLPQVVVDSLFSALGKAGLAVDSLTLEPIAAMAVAVPPHLRLLNLALVDIGAGTSDIAISREGTVISYGMVDMAGDEITESIAQHYLLDFNTAEEVKLKLDRNDNIEFADVLGNKYSEPRDALLSVVEPVVERLATALAAAIKDNNGGVAPAAVFCAGGGSLTPMLREYLALHLDLPLERVGIRRRENLEGVRFESDDLAGPDVVTPLGIAMTALRPTGGHFIKVWVNGQGVTLVNVQRATVAQALIHSGMDIEAVAGVQTGKMEFILNGVERQFTGAAGRAGAVWVNDVAATLDVEVNTGDRIEVVPGEKGSMPRVTLGQLAAEIEPLRVTVNDNCLELPLVQIVNGLPASQETEVNPGDRIEIRPPANVGELATMMDLDLSRLEVMVDDAPAALTTLIGPDSIIIMRTSSASGGEADAGGIPITVNGRALTLPSDRVMLMYALAEAQINYTQARGSLRITVNGSEADFTTMLASGDRVEVFWEHEGQGE